MSGDDKGALLGSLLGALLGLSTCGYFAYGVDQALEQLPEFEEEVAWADRVDDYDTSTTDFDEEIDTEESTGEPYFPTSAQTQTVWVPPCRGCGPARHHPEMPAGYNQEPQPEPWAPWHEYRHGY